MDMSTVKSESTVEIGRKRKRKHDLVGMCLKCGHRITFCGEPFSAEIPCSNCLFINVFQNSRQPVRGKW